jgi:outer membrane protein assembly factor BamE (lipoprotein component of BamABCDE complex)
MKRFQSVKLLLLLALAACSPKEEIHGYMPQGEIKERLVIGQTTKDEVQAALGSPSSQSTFGDESWYYIWSRRETVAFFAPKTVEQNVVRIVFNQAGVVNKVEAFDKASGKKIDIAKRITPTEGHSMGVMEQFLGNLGRFNKTGGGLPGQHSGPPGGY